MDLQTVQAGIYQGLPKHGCYLTFNLKAGVQTSQLMSSLKQFSVLAAEQGVKLGEDVVLGLGDACLSLLKADAIDDLTFPSFSGGEHKTIQVASTPNALWIWLRGEQAGDLLLLSQAAQAQLQSTFELVSVVDGFKHQDGRDLSGYLDGTENPVEQDAFDAAFVQGKSQGLNGASYVAVQQWQHDLAHLKSLKQMHQDHIIGRRLSDNYELPDAPISAHVKRTAQESFTPQAFMLRRSMPYKAALDGGLMFVCFANSPRPFAQQLNRMVGGEDGVTDGLFEFSKPLTGAYYWCPGITNGEFDLSGLS